MENIPDASALLEDLDVSGAAAGLIDGVSDAATALADTLETPPAASRLREIALTVWKQLTAKHIISTLILLLICLTFTRLVMALMTKLVNRAKIDPRVGRYVLRGIKLMMYMVTVMIVAGSLGIDVTSLVALVSVFGLAVSLAVQDTLSNIAGGIVMLFAKPFTLGDYVETDDGEGTVAEIGLTHTKLDTYAGQRLMLPNSKLSAGKIVNYTVLGVRRADNGVGVSYSCNPDKVKAACLKAVARTPNILAEPAPQAVITAYRDSSVEYHIRFWAKTEHFWDANFRFLEELYHVFAQERIKISYNHLNVHLVEEKNTKEK